MKVILAVLVVTICYLFIMIKLEYYRESNLITLTSQQSVSSDLSSKNTSTYIEEDFYVEISGQIESPGKYKMSEGSTLYDLVEKAGGLSDSADVDSIDLYYFLVSTDTSIYIPKDNGGNKISINTADLTTLQILPSVGLSTAQKIIDYRNEYGDFKLLEHIKKVSGIGNATFEKIKDYITL